MMYEGIRSPIVYPFEGSLLEPSSALTEKQLFDIAYPGGIVPTTDAPTYKVTAWAEHEKGFPWWVWLLIALLGLNLVGNKNSRRKYY